MRIIFLDVDGVLNNEKMEWTNHLALDLGAIDRVKKICENTKSRIVVSSTWRLSQKGMQALLEHFGDLIIGVTPYVGKMFHEAQRSKEIEAWIMQHSTIPLECVAVDDDSDAEGMGWKFVQTSFEDGLTPEKAAEVERAFT